MIIVDTSVLIDYLKGAENEKTEHLQQILDRDLPFGINNHIFQEVLQGAKSEREYEQLKLYLETFTFYNLQNGRNSFESAAYMHFLCRRSGITGRSTIDMLIVQASIEHGLYLLHNDSDFTNIAKVITDLKIYS